jgi:ADP-heptose:LPS heptosyltransferase
MEQLLLSNGQAPGDILMFTCAVRDLQAQAPGKYRVEVEGSALPIWHGNPYVTRINRALPFRAFNVGYSTAINQCNQRVGHFAAGFTRDLSEKLGVSIRPRLMCPDVHLLPDEMDPRYRQVKGGYWVVVAGGKSDYTAKVWAHAYWQVVVDALKADTQLVQVGSTESKHFHPPLKNVINLVGQTDLRQFMSLVYHADGIICPVTCAMHLAAAFNKPCVVLAGGREPWWWEAYTRETWAVSATEPCPDDFVEHRFLHTMGELPCCRKIGCWKSGLGEKRLGKNCRRLVNVRGQKQPACMAAIAPELVIGAVHDYMNGLPVVVDKIPERLQTPCVAVQDLPRTQAEYETMTQEYHRPRRVYGPRRRGERQRNQAQTAQSVAALRDEKIQRWRGSALRRGAQ